MRTMAAAVLTSMCLVVAAPASAQEETTWIEGHVFNKWTGVPLRSALITIHERVFFGTRPPRPPRIVARAFTDTNGFYSVELDRADLRTDTLVLTVECGDLDGVPRPSSVKARPGTVRRDLYVAGPKRRGFDTCPFLLIPGTEEPRQ